MTDRIKKITKEVVLMVLSFIAGVVFMAVKAPNLYNASLIQDKMQKEADAMRQELMANITSLTEQLADANGVIFAQSELIHKYENHDKVETEVSAIKEMRAQIFACADTDVHIEEETPVAFGTTNLQLGNLAMTRTVEDIGVRYYFATYENKITVENVEDQKIDIKYTAGSFMADPPYDVISRRTEENLGAKLLNNYGNDMVHVTIASEGRKLLSQAEDEFVRQLKEKYAESEIPVYVNGTSLEAWSAKDKVIKT